MKLSAPSLSPSRGTPSLARRISLLGCAMIGVLLAGVCAVNTSMVMQRAAEQTLSHAADKAQALVDVVEAFDTSQRELVQNFFRPFRAHFADTLALDEDAGLLRSGGHLLNNDFTAVDSFERDTGGVATVFMRRGDDFVRIATSVKKEDGSRAMGTLLDRSHPAYAEVTAGRPYVGRAQLFGRHYMTRYAPALDAAGRTVGLLFIGFDLTSFQNSMQALVQRTRLFDSGGLYVVAPPTAKAPARFVFHPQAAGRPVADAVAGGDAWLTRLAEGGEAVLRHALPVLSASPADAGERWAVRRTSPHTGWWVVAEVSRAEALAPHWSALRAFWALLLLAALALGLGLQWLLRRTVSRPLQQLGQSVDRLAQGRFDQPITTTRRDEVGRLVQELEGMRRHLGALLRQVHGSADSVSTAAAEIAQGNRDLSVRTEQTATSLQQTAASVQHLTATVRSSADAAATANQLATSASEAARRGGEVVSQVVSTMDGIQGASRRIEHIIGTIDGIAFQTNILALNAAVEAARAGESGRGFAVVAAEVRALAQRSAEAAREIKTLIGQSVQQVESGSALVQDAGRTMEEIVQGVHRVCDVIGDISAAAAEQSGGIGQVNTAVEGLDRMTQQNAALVEEGTTAAQSLHEQATRLRSLVSHFQLGA